MTAVILWMGEQSSREDELELAKEIILTVFKLLRPLMHDDLTRLHGVLLIMSFEVKMRASLEQSFFGGPKEYKMLNHIPHDVL